MELYISIILNVIFLLIILNLQGKSKEVEEKIVYVPEIIYRNKIEYKDRVVYQDRVVKEYVSPPSNVVVNNNIGNSKKPKAVKKIKEKVSEPLENVSSKRAEILKELATLKSKKNKTKQDIDNIYTLEMILPNIK